MGFRSQRDCCSIPSDFGYIRVQYAPVIARVCGFARGAAESKKTQTSVITGV